MIYEDYFKSVVGGNFNSPEYYNDPTYENKTYEPRQVSTLPNYNYSSSNYMDDEKIMDLYPDIYKVVSPMIEKMILAKNVNDLNENNLNEWTLEIYDALEAEDDNANKRNITYESETTNANISKPSNLTNNRNNTISINNNLTNSATNNSIARSQVDNTKIVNNAIKTTNTVNSAIKSANTVSNVMNTASTNIDKSLEVVSRYRNRNNPLLRDLIRIMILNRLFGNNGGNRPRPRPYPDFDRPNNFNPRPDFRPTSVNPYSQYLKNKPKTYFDVPYPEE